MRKKRLLMTALFAAVLVMLMTIGSYAQSVPVVQDNGSGNQYNALPTNYVQIVNMNVGYAEVTGSGYSQVFRKFGTTEQWGLVYTGRMNFGSHNATNSSAADLADNHLPDVTLRWNNGARLPDGTYADIVMALSDIHVMCGKPSVSANQTFYTTIMSGWGFRSQPPYTTGWDSSKAATGTYMKASVKIVSRGTDTVIPASSYPTMLVEFVDLDIRDKTMKKSASDAAKGNGTFAEGITMVSGWVGNAVIAPDTADIANTRLVNSDTWNGSTRIKVDGPKQMEFQDKTGSHALGDYSTLWSGFIGAVQPQGFSLYWTGSSPGGNTIGVATQMGGQPTVAVLAMREGGGAAESSLGGPTTYSGVNSWYTNTHLMNSSSTYTATPGAGIFLESMNVEGTNLPISASEKTAGKAYTFEKLNKYPLPHRDIRNGQVLASSGSGYYTIKAAFRHFPKYAARKDLDKSKIQLGSDEEVHYQIVCNEIFTDAPEGTHTLHDDLADGVLVVDPDSINVTCEHGSATYDLNENGLDIVFSSDDANGSKPKMILTYTATVDWEKYAASPDNDVINTVAGRNTPEAGGDPTGNSVQFAIASSIKVTKTVAGKLRDMSKKFEFEVSLTGLEPDTAYGFDSIGGGDLDQVVTGKSTANGFRSTPDGEAILLFKATGRQGFIIKNLPIGAHYQIKEAPSDHVASYKITSESERAVIAKAEDENLLNHAELSTETETLDKNDAVISIAFTNTRNPVTVTGVIHDYSWALIAALLLAGGGIIALIRRREAANEKNNR